MAGAFARVAGVYVLALAAGVAAAALAPVSRPLWQAAVADGVATCVVFAASVRFRNSSLYDPYWSVAPIAIALYWAFAAESAWVDVNRQIFVIALIAWWGGRLTWNWARGWGGLGHEDWRYRQLQEQSGRLYWGVSFVGIHMLPTVVVFLGLLPVYAALSVGTRPWGALDVLAAVVTAAAIACEQTADRQLLRFRRAGPAPGAILDTGLWARSRHPNYLGEMGFWWGLYLFGLAAKPEWWWTGVGALAITLMFLGVSLPLIETRMLERRPGYAAHQRRVPRLLPGLRRAGAQGPGP